MKTIFVDTSAWVALMDSADKYHLQAISKLKMIMQKRWQLTTSSDVLDETYTLLFINTGYSQVLQFKQKLNGLLSINLLKLAWITPEISEQAWQIFVQFNRDKEWSFTDCTSFAVMQNDDIDTVFTFDHHFLQMSKIIL